MFFKFTSNCAIAIKSDSSTVVAYINKQGGTNCNLLCDKSLRFWKFCIKRNLNIKAFHLAGTHNSRADFLFRHFSFDHSYSLRQDIFNLIKVSLPFKLVIDCFASRLNSKLPNYISWVPDPFSILTDSFSFIWKDFINLFPPIPLIDKVLAKFISDKVGHGLLICPYWPSQTWYPTLLELLIGPPLLLPPDSILDEDCKIPKHSRLLGGHIGLGHQEKQAYRNGLQSVPCEVIDSKLCLNIKDIGDNSILGFIQNKIITVKLL